MRTLNGTRLQLYIDQRLSTGAKRATVQREIAVVRRMFRLGYAKRRVAQLPHFPTLEVENTRRVFFGDEEVDRLVDALAKVGERAPERNAWLPVYARVQDAVGWRRNELLALERRRHMNLHVSGDEGYLELDGSMTKNGEPRRAYLSGVALETLRRWER